MNQDLSSTPPSDVPLGEISQKPPFLEVFLDRHQKKIIILALALVVAVITYVISTGIKESKEQSAGALLVKAENIASLEKIVNAHQGTAAATSAKLRIANLQWEQGQQNEAISTLTSLVKEAETHSVLPLVKISLSDKLSSQGKNDEALALLNEITNDPNYKFLAPYALISTATIEIKKGNLDAAIQSLDQVKRDFEKTTYSSEAGKLALLARAETPKEMETKKEASNKESQPTLDEIKNVDQAADPTQK